MITTKGNELTGRSWQFALPLCDSKPRYVTACRWVRCSLEVDPVLPPLQIGDQIADPYAERVGEPHQGVNADRLLSPLDLSHINRVQTGLLSQLFLRQPRPLPVPADGFADESSLSWRCGHALLGNQEDDFFYTVYSPSLFSCASCAARQNPEPVSRRRTRTTERRLMKPRQDPLVTMRQARLRLCATVRHVPAPAEPSSRGKKIFVTFVKDLPISCVLINRAHPN